jgi:hypothetical protein
LLETKEADEVRLHSLTTGYEAPNNLVVDRGAAPGRRAIRLQDSSL